MLIPGKAAELPSMHRIWFSIPLGSPTSRIPQKAKPFHNKTVMVESWPLQDGFLGKQLDNMLSRSAMLELKKNAFLLLLPQLSNSPSGDLD